MLAIMNWPSESVNTSGNDFVPSSVAFKNRDTLFWSTTPARWFHSSWISVLPSIVVHLMPSKTENFAIRSGGIILLTESTNELSFETTVYSASPAVKSGFIHANTVNPSVGTLGGSDGVPSINVKSILAVANWSRFMVSDVLSVVKPGGGVISTV